MKTGCLVALLAALFLVPLLTNSIMLVNNCFNNFDFGVYLQAALDIAYGISWNPVLSTHGNITHFGIHFDPVIYFTVPFVWLFGYHPLSLLVFEWLIFCLPPIIVWRLKFLDNREVIFFSLFYVFSRGILYAVNYPVHASFWSIPLWVLLPFFLQRDNFKGIVLICLALPLFKESYPFSVLCLSFYYAFMQRWKRSLVILAISVFYLVVCFVLRPYLMPVIGHGHDMITQLITSPIEYLSASAYRIFTNDGLLKEYVTIFLPFCPLFFFLFVKVRDLNHFIFPLLFMLMPLFLMQFLLGRIDLQYSFPFVASFLMATFLDKEFKKLIFPSVDIFLDFYSFLLPLQSIL